MKQRMQLFRLYWLNVNQEASNVELSIHRNRKQRNGKNRITLKYKILFTMKNSVSK